jgi:GH24 family phage-related lysozyme (muramidase)
MFDTWDEIGGEGGKYRYHPIAVVKDCWLDMGDSAGWGIWPADNIFGHSYQKPAVNLDANPAVPAAAASSTASTAAPRRFKPQEFRANSIAAKFIGHFEGMELKQYTDCVGIDTIGIGTTRWHDGGPIPVGTAITKEEALAFFQRDAVEFIAEIQRLVDVPLTARQIAAVLSFCYNCGWQGFEESSVLQSINANAPFDEIRTNLRKWSKGDNGVLPGLLRRRNAEAMLWD